MPIYSFQASNTNGDIVKSSIDACDEAAVIAHVRAEGLIPIKIKKGRRIIDLSKKVGGKKITTKTLSIFTMELATLLEAGLPLDRSLSILINIETLPAWRHILEDLLAKVKSGMALSDAMRQHDKIFDDFYVGLVNAGELSGSLNLILERLAHILENKMETQAGVRRALFYPVMLMTVGLAVVVYILLAVIPKFEKLIAQNNSNPPLISDIIFAMSNGLRHYWYILFIIIVIGMLWLRSQFNNQAKREKWHAGMLTKPLVGTLIRKLELARLARTLGTMLAHGVPIPTALQTVKQSINNKAIANEVSTALQSLKSGQGLAKNLIASKTFPTLGVQMIKVGEETGKLDKMLLKVADIYDKEVKNSTETIVATISPIAILSIAAMIFILMLGVILAVYSLNPG